MGGTHGSIAVDPALSRSTADGLRWLADRSGDALLVTDAAGRIMLANTRIEALLQHPAAGLIGRPVEEVLPPEPGRTRPDGRADGAAGSNWTTAAIAVRGDGSQVTVDSACTTVETSDGPLNMLLLRPGSTRQFPGNRLERDVTRLAAVVDSSRNAIIGVGPDGRIHHWNLAAERLLGYSAAEAVGRHPSFIVPPDLPEHVDSVMTRLRAGKMVEPFETRRRHRDGHDIDVLISAFAVYDPQGELIGTCGVFTDLTATREAEHARSLLAAVVESSPDAIISTDIDHRIVSLNPAAEQLIGYPRAAAIGMLGSVLLPDGAATAGPKVLAGSSVNGFESYMRHRDGHLIRVSITAFPVRDQQGTVAGISSIVRDITERYENERQRARLAAIIESSGTAIASVGTDALITTWNAAAEQLFGWTAGEAIGRAFEILSPSGMGDELRSVIAGVLGGELIEPQDVVLRHRDGQLLDVSISQSLIRYPDGTLAGASVFAFDIADRKRAERQLRDAHEAAEAAGQEYEAFAYAVAHDLRSPLRSIDGHCYLAQDELTRGNIEGVPGHLDAVRASAKRMAVLIDSLLGLAQVTRREPVFRPVDLSALACEVIERLRGEDPHRQAEVTVQPGLKVTGDPALLSVVMTNLIGNAWKFSRERTDARIEVFEDDDGFVVRDNGAGFDMAYADKLFGLFQRLHRPDQFSGTGIGLATTQRIVRQHGGRIWAQSVAGESATFHFTIGDQR